VNAWVNNATEAVALSMLFSHVYPHIFFLIGFVSNPRFGVWKPPLVTQAVSATFRLPKPRTSQHVSEQQFLGIRTLTRIFYPKRY